MRILFLFFLLTSAGFSQTNTYTISFENAGHHEANVKVTFPYLKQDSLSVRMSRTSPGRYALHEFAKNVYGVKATNSKGEKLEIIRPDPYSWTITDHDGTVNLEYILFGNRADGTYTQIDENHAHLNIPATFMYSEALKKRPVEVTFDTQAHPTWKIATQLKQLEGNKYYAPDLYYFMDSPTEISDFDSREFEIDGEEIKFILHHPGTEQEFDEYWEQVKEIVRQQKAIFGELPEFDFGEYTFLACYMPNVSGDGMEHRNSTVLTDVTSLGEGGMKENIGTVAHEFFHAWNVERIRPESLEPFDFTEANMSGLLWFAEGFTSYYTGVTLARAGILTPEEYVKSLNGTFNYVWNSPAREFFNPVEMSYQAPFVDAAASIDPVNRENTFISYYSYGSMLGLALDLQLRQKGQNLDEFMKLVWETYGETEIPYDIEDLERALSTYAGKEFAKSYFNDYIYSSKMPDYEKLFAHVGLQIKRGAKNAFFGASVRTDDDGFYISGNPYKGSPAYTSGLSEGDQIISLSGIVLEKDHSWKDKFSKFNPQDTITLEIERFGRKMKKTVMLEKDPAYTISIDPKATAKAVKEREAWLSKK
ncbi:M61 family metallopeptidase [Salinimicrobium sp. TH3]|uniref:M61 family metallopeptidase n=1 Tax=Salinimicrobium sp. TH3 TaxID=2997342 RepID=UPI002273D24D|nr:peptidase M61 [Salinimicrobium sp. TH3]MCY2686286.1 peptidase M61 [Salinimicrobium sp. TH3]